MDVRLIFSFRLLFYGLEGVDSFETISPKVEKKTRKERINYKIVRERRDTHFLLYRHATIIIVPII